MAGSVPGRLKAGGVAECLERTARGRTQLSDVHFRVLQLVLGLFSVGEWLKVGQHGVMSHSASN